MALNESAIMFSMLRLNYLLAILFITSFVSAPPAVDMWVDTYGLVWITADPTVPVLTIDVSRDGVSFPPGPVSGSFADCITETNTITCKPEKAGVWMLVLVGVQPPPGGIIRVRASGDGHVVALDLSGPPAPIYLPIVSR